MKILFSWLKEFVDIDITPVELAEKLVSAGFEIEEIIDERSKVVNTVVGKIVGIEKHPNADKLSVCYVKIGQENIDIVTNSKTVKIGDLVPVALDGAVLANGINIKKGELRGVMSYGMFCGPEELGLEKDEYPGADKDEVLVLKNTAVIGTDINDEIGHTDVILDIALTANRADCCSVLGIAREVAAVTGKQVKMPDLTFKSVNRPCALKDVNVVAKDLCPRYMAAEVSDVKIVESPEIIKTRLRKIGIRPINNIVDITNYVLIEIGQPMHAFDFNLLEGSEINVRLAENDEKIIALDGKEYTLSNKNLAICDKEKIVAIAGVMGGELFSVMPDTNRIIFESARFARDSVRQTSRALKLFSDSSARYEKGVDFYCQEVGLKRALNLIDKYGYGSITADIIDTNPSVDKKVIRTTLQKINSILGIDVPKDVVLKILNSLNIETAISENGELISVIPLYREDIFGANDLAEEVIRIYGYDHLEPTLLNKGGTIKGGRTKSQKTTAYIKQFLVARGMHEIVTYSFVSPKMFDVLRIPEDSVLRKCIKIENPIGEDFSIMRTTLAYSMLKTIAYNYQKGNKEGRFFEVAKRYFEDIVNEQPAKEFNTLCIGAIGEKENFYTIKGVIENLFESLDLDSKFVATEKSYMHPTRTADIYIQGNYVGYIGEVHPLVTAEFDIDKRMYVAELDLETIIRFSGKMPIFESISKFQAVERDLAVLVDQDVIADDIINAVKNADQGIIENVKIFDVYQGSQVEQGKKSVAIKITLRDKNTTLTDAMVVAQIEAIMKSLNKETGATLRS